MSRDNYVNLTRGNIQAIAGAVNARRAAERAALKTTNKGSYVAAINELKDNIDKHIAPKEYLEPIEKIGVYTGSGDTVFHNAYAYASNDNEHVLLFIEYDASAEKSMHVYHVTQDGANIEQMKYDDTAVQVDDMYNVIIHNQYVSFIDEVTGRLFYSSDYGKTFNSELAKPSGYTAWMPVIIKLDANGERAYIISGTTKVLYTSNYGATWNSFSTTNANTSLYMCVATMNGSEYLINAAGSSQGAQRIDLFTSGQLANSYIIDQRVFNAPEKIYYDDTLRELKQWSNGNLTPLSAHTCRLTSHNFGTFDAITCNGFTVNVTNCIGVFETIIPTSWCPIYIFVFNDHLTVFNSYNGYIKNIFCAIDTTFGLRQFTTSGLNGINITTASMSDSVGVYPEVIFKLADTSASSYFCLLLEMDYVTITRIPVYIVPSGQHSQYYATSSVGSTGYNSSENNKTYWYSYATSTGGVHTEYSSSTKQTLRAMQFADENDAVYLYYLYSNWFYYGGINDSNDSCITSNVASYTPVCGDVFTYTQNREADVFSLDGILIFLDGTDDIKYSIDSGTTWISITPLFSTALPSGSTELNYYGQGQSKVDYRYTITGLHHDYSGEEMSIRIGTILDVCDCAHEWLILFKGLRTHIHLSKAQYRAKSVLNNLSSSSALGAKLRHVYAIDSKYIVTAYAYHPSGNDTYRDDVITLDDSDTSDITQFKRTRCKAATLPIAIGNDTFIYIQDAGYPYEGTGILNGVECNMYAYSTYNRDLNKLIVATLLDDTVKTVGSMGLTILNYNTIAMYVSSVGASKPLGKYITYNNFIMQDSCVIPLFNFSNDYDAGYYCFMLTDENGNIIMDEEDIDTKAVWAYNFNPSDLCYKHKMIEYDGHLVPGELTVDEYYDPESDYPTGERHPEYDYVFKGSLFDLINYCRYS